MNNVVNAIILGVVEGLTEFLPVSSTGHLIIMNEFMGFTGQFAKMFDVVIQLGAILSVVVYFRHKLYPFSSTKTLEEKSETWDIWKKAIVGVVPALILGFLLGKLIKEYLFNSITVSIALVIGGILLIILESRKMKIKTTSMKDLSYKTVFFIGIFQCLAMIPGTSRSAATIIGAMLLGSSRLVAAEFSFFLAIPTMCAATAYSLLKMDFNISVEQIQLIAIGFIVSFLVAWLVIAGFMKFIAKHNFKPFGYYRIVLGIIVFLYFMGYLGN